MKRLMSVSVFFVLLMLSFGGAPCEIAAQSGCVVPLSGLVAWWPGDGNASDIRGSNNGTRQNSASFASGVVGQAFSFDGVDDHISTNLDVQPSAMPNTTWAAWVFPTRVNYGDRQTIMSGDDHGFDRSVGIERNTAQFMVYTGANPPWLVTSVDVNQWQYIAVVYTANSIKFYKNGIEFTYAGTPTGSMASSKKFQIGWNPCSSCTEHFQGRIDEVEVFSVALSQAQIQTLYGAGNAGQCKPECTTLPSNIVSWWKADGHPGDSVDSNHGTLENGATFASGPVGQAFSFDGVNDDVLVGNSSALNVQTGDFTLEAWVFLKSTNHYHFIAGKEGCASPNLFALYVDPTNHPFFAVFNSAGGSFYATSPNTITLNAWHHVAGVRQGSSIKLFVDGSLVRTLAISGTFAASADPFTIGDRPACRIPLDGLVDEVALYDRALSASEIQTIVTNSSLTECNVRTGGVVDSNATFLHISSNDATLPPLIINLAAAGFTPGTNVTISYLVPSPGFSYAGCSGPFVSLWDTPLLGVFSSSATLLPTSASAHVPDAIDAGTDIETPNTFTGNEPTNIPQDFRVLPPAGMAIQVSAGATHLFLGTSDSFFANCGTILVNLQTSNRPPTANAGGLYIVGEGGSVSLAGVGSDLDLDPLTYAWDLDNNGSYETPGQNTVFSAAGLDGPSSRTVGLQVCDNQGACAISTAAVTIQNVAPSVATPVVSSEPSVEGAPVTASTTFSDLGLNDTPFTCTANYGDGDGALTGTVSGNTCTGPNHSYTTAGSYTVTIAVKDKDLGTGSASMLHVVNVPPTFTPTPTPTYTSTATDTPTPTPTDTPTPTPTDTPTPTGRGA